LWLVVLLAVLLLFASIEVLLALIAASKLAKPPRDIGKWTPRDLGLGYEDIVVKTRDGVELKGWFIKGSLSSSVILVHGYTASKYNEDYIKPAILMLAKRGFNVLVYDQRGHGDSGGEYTTLGYREVDDLNDVVEWLRKSYPDASRRIGVIGYSMGGAVVLMHASKHGSLDVYIADSPYIDVFQSGKRWIKRSREPLRSMLLLVYPLIVKLVEAKTGVNGSELVLYRYAPGLKNRKVMIIAGTRDDLVDIDEVKRFVEEARKAGGEVELWVTDSKHVASITDNPSEYGERVLGFLERWFA